MSLSAKILTPFIALITLFSVSLAYDSQALSEALSSISLGGDALSSVTPSLSEVSYEARALEGGLRRWRIRGSSHADIKRERALELQLERVSARFEQVAERLSELNSPHHLKALQGKSRALLVSFVTLKDELRRLLREPPSLPPSQPPPQPSHKQGDPQPSLSTLTRASEEVTRLSLALSRWSEQVRALGHQVTRLAQRQREGRQALEREALLRALSLIILITLIGLGVTLYLARLLAPLKLLKEGVERLEEGSYEHRVEVSGGGAFAQLALALNRMAEAIEQRDQQLEAQQTERLHQARLATVGKLTAQITHELRNPLSSIGLNAELLDEELEDLSRLLASAESSTQELKGARALLREITREIDRLRVITEDYLRFARLPRAELTPLDLTTQCAELIDFVRPEYDEARVRLHLDADPSPRAALIDPNHTRAALLNLLRNAREALASQPNPVVVVRVRSWGDEACVSVEDNGPGLTTEAQARLFEPFFSTKPQGTGLGLAMTRQLMETQGGRVLITPRSPHGVCVSLYVRVWRGEG